MMRFINFSAVLCLFFLLAGCGAGFDSDKQEKDRPIVKPQPEIPDNNDNQNPSDEQFYDNDYYYYSFYTTESTNSNEDNKSNQVNGNPAGHMGFISDVAVPSYDSELTNSDTTLSEAKALEVMNDSDYGEDSEYGNYDEYNEYAGYDEYDDYSAYGDYDSSNDEYGAYEASEEEYDNDPLEPLNRAIYEFNYVIDGLLLKPVAGLYRDVVPSWGRQRVGNALRNITEPIDAVNSAFQRDPEQAFTSVWRFLINSTFGLLGMFDAAEEIGLSYRNEDFGQTLGHYDIGAGPYLMLPILGPSNLRDGFGMIVDSAFNPMSYADETEALIYNVTNGIHTRSELLDIIDDIEQNSLDPYVTIRSGYFQRRNSLIRDVNDIVRDSD